MSKRPMRHRAASLQEDMVRFVAAQDVVDEIGRDRDLPASLFLARMATFDQAGDHCTLAKRALQHEAFGKPGLQIIAQHVLVEQVTQREMVAVDHLSHIVQRPDGECIIIGDETERPSAGRSSRR